MQIADHSARQGVLATSVTYGGVISETGSVTQAGSGTLILTGINTLSGL